MHFEQSDEWARFQQAVGRKVYVVSPTRIVSFEKDATRSADEGIAVERRIVGPFHYLEVSDWSMPGSDAARTIQIMQESGLKTGAVFVRWTPTVSQKSKFKSQKFGEVKIVVPQILIHQVSPHTTLIIDVSKGEEELLQEMHEKTRYNIRLAERKGVAVHEAHSADGFEQFWTLMQETARRDRIGIHQKEYYRKMLEIVQGTGAHAHLFLVTHDRESLATAILIICGDTATYLHGGSSSEHRSHMAPHLLQWRMMQFAKTQGCRWYDLWGISSKITHHTSHITNLNSDPWAGITRFKMGFGGEVREGSGTFDIVCTSWLYSLLAFLRRMRF